MKDSGIKILMNGVLNRNPVWVLFLGMCPALATTTSAINGMSMGLATFFDLFGSNIVVSILKNIMPDKVRITGYIMIIGTFVTVAEMLIHAYFPAVFINLGIFIPLIVVNCIILGRAEAFASKNPVFRSALDAIGMGLGFTLALTLLGVIRELLGTGKAFGTVIFPDHYGAIIFVLAPGAFIVLGYLIAAMNKIRNKVS